MPRYLLWHLCVRLTVCVGPPGWHRSECDGRSHSRMLSKGTHEGREGGEVREGGSHMANVHQEACYSLPYINASNKTTTGRASISLKTRRLRNPCSVLKFSLRPDVKMYSHISGSATVWWGKELCRKKRKKNTRHMNEIPSFKGNDLKALWCGQWFPSFLENTDSKATLHHSRGHYLLALIDGGEGLVFTCPLLTVICDCGKHISLVWILMIDVRQGRN